MGGLGFRSFGQFNIALLAKQGWRLINFPNSLLEKVLKAKYYPNSDFIHAQLENLPSLTWKSVWTAKWLLKYGLCWRVGKGDQISIWNDRWIPSVDIDRSNDSTNNTEIELVSYLIDITQHRRFCKFLWRKKNMTIFKSGEENILANFQSEVPINYYKRQIWILAII
ncbi:RNA-directed DNA polymerase reverse transcriptase family protein [Gossypium australe]|uniref:RNA-directed DNA polymerase reverse transcriptase family protein n=1 Tax=Gossypium australe TaxID=47621 RepID=A0A5B6W7P6_9ROSI|nr:RNA-directed DNA polymerase reverse transcriptase family protein [Gossypium australe]